MKRSVLLIIIIAFMVTLYANPPVALTLKMRGDVTLDREESISQLSEGTALHNRDSLQSSDESYAFIKFVDDGATLRLFPNSIMTIIAQKNGENLDKGGFLQVGNVFSKVNKDRGEYRVETPTTVASVKGTEGFVIVDENGTTTIITIKGTFEVYNKESGLTIDVTEGNTATSTADGLLESEPTGQLDEELLDSLEDVDDVQSNTLKIEVLNDEGDRKIIEIEFK